MERPIEITDSSDSPLGSHLHDMTLMLRHGGLFYCPNNSTVLVNFWSSFCQKIPESGASTKERMPYFQGFRHIVLVAKQVRTLSPRPLRSPIFGAFFFFLVNIWSSFLLSNKEAAVKCANAPRLRGIHMNFFEELFSVAPRCTTTILYQSSNVFTSVIPT